MKPKVFIEILPRLETCYVFIKSEKKMKHLSLKDTTINLIYVDETEDTIQVDFVILKPDTISSLEVYDSVINFRVQLDKIISSKFSTSLAGLSDNFKFKPFFKENYPISIKCRCCDHEIFPTLSFRRVLPLPSGVLDKSEFFCHDHSDSVTKASLSPGAEDCFYGNFYILLQPTNANILNILHCERCLSWLGTFSNKILKLWDCSTVLSDEKQFETLEIAYRQFRQTISHVASTSFFGSIKIVVESRVEENETNYLLLWIVDNDLACFVNAEIDDGKPVSLMQKCVSKVLYLFQGQKTTMVESWMKNINVTTIDVAKQMLLSALSNLNAINKMLPPQSRQTNNMYLSYLDPIL